MRGRGGRVGGGRARGAAGWGETAGPRAGARLPAPAGQPEGLRSSPERAARSCGQVNLVRLLGVGAQRADAPGLGPAGGRSCRGRRWGSGGRAQGAAPPTPRWPSGTLHTDLGPGLCDRATPGPARQQGSVRGSPTAGRGPGRPPPGQLCSEPGPGAVRARSGAAALTPGLPPTPAGCRPPRVPRGPCSLRGPGVPTSPDPVPRRLGSQCRLAFLMAALGIKPGEPRRGVGVVLARGRTRHVPGGSKFPRAFPVLSDAPRHLYSRSAAWSSLRIPKGR